MYNCVIARNNATATNCTLPKRNFTQENTFEGEPLVRDRGGDVSKGFWQGGLTSVYKTEIVQNLVHHEPQCLYTYVSAGVL